MATRQKRAAQHPGFTPHSANTATLNVNAANTWLGFAFSPDVALTINNVRTYLSAIGGSMLASELTASLYNDTSGLPSSGAAVETHGAGSVPAVGVVDFTGFTTALTAGTQYWIVFKNANGTPGTNNATFRWMAAEGGIVPVIGGSSGGAQSWGWFKAHTTTGDGGWGTITVASSGGIRVGYSDGSYDGLLFTNVANSGDLIYVNRESGIKFTTSSNAVLKIRGASMLLGTRVSTPVGGIRFRLYSGTGASPTLLGTTNTIVSGNATGGGQWYPAYFIPSSGSADSTGTITVQPSTVLRLTCCDATGGDSAAACYRLDEWTIDGDANSLIQLPYGGTCQKTYGNPDNTSFAETSTAVVAFSLIPNSDGEFGAVGGAIGNNLRGGFCNG